MMNRLDINGAVALLREPKNTLILCHKNPDPDTLGSAFALKCVLEVCGSVVTVACCDAPAKKLGFITGENSLEYKEKEYERYVAVDVASPTQLGELEFLADRVELTIDHHKMCTRFSDYYECFLASNAENIYHIAEKMGIIDTLPLVFFECVYAGMSGDTGCFRFSNTTPDTLNTAAQVVSHGIDHAEINRIIFDSKTIEEIKAQRLTYEHMELFFGGKLSCVLFTNEMKEQNGISDSDIGDIVSYLRSVDGVLVAVSLKETKEKGKYSLSSRANTDIDVSAVCQSIGGGGHTRAAGATLYAENARAAINMVKELFGKSIKEYEARC
ncbi:MAG: bifunctional oligoribonuclease/PAP phosphatase NrnA [Clostridia bacterium]|nr:bifunctional oligoribonuclease/PAP phosphatase NrnA [Clostridia bacterium]